MTTTPDVVIGLAGDVLRYISVVNSPKPRDGRSDGARQSEVCGPWPEDEWLDSGRR